MKLETDFLQHHQSLVPTMPYIWTLMWLKSNGQCLKLLIDYSNYKCQLDEKLISLKINSTEIKNCQWGAPLITVHAN